MHPITVTQSFKGRRFETRESGKNTWEKSGLFFSQTLLYNHIYFIHSRECRFSAFSNPEALSTSFIQSTVNPQPQNLKECLSGRFRVPQPASAYNSTSWTSKSWPAAEYTSAIKTSRDCKYLSAVMHSQSSLPLCSNQPTDLCCSQTECRSCRL